MKSHIPRYLFLAAFLLICASCDLEEGNRRGYVISKGHEVPSEESADWAQP